MKRCVRCGYPSGEGSFYADEFHPDDVCKICIHRPRSARVRARILAHKKNVKTRHQRAQAAIRYVVKHAQENGESFVYLMRSLSNYKIGVSTDVSKRLRQLSTASSAPIQLIAVVPGGRQLEQKLHEEFKPLRVHREWFRNIDDTIVNRFSQLEGAMVFLLGFVTSNLPPSCVMDDSDVTET